MSTVLEDLVQGLGTWAQGLGSMGTWPWGHWCDWGGHGWYRGGVRGCPRSMRGHSR